MREYIISYKGEWWYFYIKNQVGLCVRKKDSSRFGAFEIIEKDVLDDFCVLTQGTHIYIACQNSTGSVIMLMFDGKDWQKEVLLSSKNQHSYPKNFSMINLSGYINLIYTILHNDRLMLIHHTLGANKTPEVVDYIKKCENPYCICTMPSTDFALFYKNEGGETVKRVYKWSQKAYLAPVLISDEENLNVKFICPSDDDKLCFTATRKKDGKCEIVYFTKSDSSSPREQIIFSGCDETAFPIVCKYDDKKYVVWIDKGYILSSFSQDEKNWSSPLKYTKGSKVTLFSIIEKDKESFYYGSVRENDILLYGTHDILKRAPKYDAPLDFKNIKETENDKTLALKKLAEQEKKLIELNEELKLQRKFITDLCNKIDKLLGNVPIAESDDVIDDILLGSN